MIFFKDVSKDLSIKMDVLHFYKHVVEPLVSAIKLFKSFFVRESIKEKNGHGTSHVCRLDIVVVGMYI